MNEFINELELTLNPKEYVQNVLTNKAKFIISPNEKV